MRALRATYVLALLAGATYLGLQQAWDGAALLAVGGLFKARTWLSPWLAARRALDAPWRAYREGAFEALVPPGWTARLTDGEDLLLEGDDAWVRAGAIIFPFGVVADATQEVTNYLKQLGESKKLRDLRPAEGSIGGLPATGQAATFATLQEVGTFECLGTRWSDGRILIVNTWRGLSVPGALLARCMDGVHLRPLT